ncbi:hypothetical protein ASD37_20365 [Mycobacterium sp. Root135]|nr:hypothetical protein ASD37_20365 [Mycobacterium sp. Root135]
MLFGMRRIPAMLLRVGNPEAVSLTLETDDQVYGWILAATERLIYLDEDRSLRHRQLRLRILVDDLRRYVFQYPRNDSRGSNVRGRVWTKGEVTPAV